MNQKQVMNALTSALYRLVECLDEVNTCGPHFDPEAMEDAAGEIWMHLARARAFSSNDTEPCDICVVGRLVGQDDCAACGGTGLDPFCRGVN